ISCIDRDKVLVMITDLPCWPNREFGLSNSELAKNFRSRRLFSELSGRNEVATGPLEIPQKPLQVSVVTRMHSVHPRSQHDGAVRLFICGDVGPHQDAVVCRILLIDPCNDGHSKLLFFVDVSQTLAQAAKNANRGFFVSEPK